MAEQPTCKKPEEHHLHLCELKTTMKKSELAPLLRSPRYVCAICGGKVGRGRNLCAPKRLRS